MRTLKYITITLIALMIISCKTDKKKDKKEPEKVERIVSLNGTITEVLVTLGYEKQLVAVDITSMYPKRLRENKNIKQLGHTRGITIEAILAQKPTKIFAEEGDIPDKLKEQLKDSKVPVTYYKKEKSVAGAKQLIKAIAKDFNQEKIADEIIAKIDEDIKGLKEIKNKPKVMFVYARGAGTLFVSGTDTPVTEMVALSGGENAVTSYKDYKPLTAEAVISANPDVLLFFTSGLQSLGGFDGLKQVPALLKTTAVKKKQVIDMDGLYLTGFGPRVGKAIKELNEKLLVYAK